MQTEFYLNEKSLVNIRILVNNGIIIKVTGVGPRANTIRNYINKSIADANEAVGNRIYSVDLNRLLKHMSTLNSIILKIGNKLESGSVLDIASTNNRLLVLKNEKIMYQKEIDNTIKVLKTNHNYSI